MIFAIIIIGVLFIVISSAKFKLHPFLGLIIAALLVGIASGMPLADVVTNINEGFGGLMTSIGIIIVAGTIIGTILERSGAAYRMAEVVLRIVGPKHPQLAMSLIGYVVSIPVFCDSGYIILSSLQKSLAKRAAVPLATMAVALSTGLFATHTLVPPTPGPIAAAGNIGATNYLGTIIVIGLLVAIPVTLVGYLWAVYAGRKVVVRADNEPALDYEEVIKSFGKMPSTFKSFLPIVLPIVLIAIGSIATMTMSADSSLTTLLVFFGSPTIALLCGVAAAFLLLPEMNETTLNDWIADSLKDAAPILLVTGAGGAFGTVIKNTSISDTLQNMDFSSLTGALFLLVPFLIAAALKTAQGSSTASLVITSSLVAPMLVTMGIEGAVPLALVVMALGAGAMTVSHVNDSFFWVVTQFSGMDVKDAYKTHTVATLLQGLTALIISMLLWLLLV
ncbi:gluconate transporter [Kurthia sp. 3B1D]|uniref:Gluconate transporter n=1 Tax=Candidatus Kurthia intestinigallinarum TaxID=1562256 RepID=A0A433RYQ1_9BACL|nr:GntP family permease [Kurthia sp. 3B1D]RUS58413.1 gluconate transporter [Kurthia sp. 3B1D]